MKKKLLSLLMAFCLILPLASTLVACGDDDDDTDSHTCTASTTWSHDDTHHWHNCTDENCDLVLDKAEHTFVDAVDVAPTIDADGSGISTCSACGKTKQYTIDKLVQTEAEMFEVYADAKNINNYSGKLQQVYIHQTNSSNFQSKLDSDLIETTYSINNNDGTGVIYEISNTNPELISYSNYIEKVGNDFFKYDISANNQATANKIYTKTIVGENYFNNLFEDTIDGDLSILGEAQTKTELIEYIDGELVGFVERIKSALQFTYDINDIENSLEVKYENQIYSAKGYSALNLVSYAFTTPVKYNNFKVEYELEFNKDMITKIYIKSSCDMLTGQDTLATTDDDTLTNFYVSYSYNFTKTVDDTKFNNFKTIADGLTYEGTPSKISEKINFYVNNVFYSSTHTEFDAPINTEIDNFITTLKTTIGQGASATAYLDSEFETAYNKLENLFVEDFYGRNIYIIVGAPKNHSVILTSYNCVSATDANFEHPTNEHISIEIVETGTNYDIVKNYNSKDYTAKMIYNDYEATLSSIEVSNISYTIVLYRIGE